MTFRMHTRPAAPGPLPGMRPARTGPVTGKVEARRRMTRYPFFLLTAMILFGAPAGAASFDCAKAAKPDERAICANADLSALDSEMGGLWFAFSKVPMLMGSSGARRDDAQAFLQQRAQCGGNVDCLRPLYYARIGALKSGVSQAMDNYFQLQNADPCPK